MRGFITHMTALYYEYNEQLGYLWQRTTKIGTRWNNVDYILRIYKTSGYKNVPVHIRPPDCFHLYLEQGAALL